MTDSAPDTPEPADPSDPALAAQRCVLPTCGAAYGAPRGCGRVAGHSGDHGPRNPFLIGDPRYGTLVCRACGERILADEPYRKVVRLAWLPGRGGWSRSFAHAPELLGVSS